jgi:Mor family transcriptional regulator
MTTPHNPLLSGNEPQKYIPMRTLYAYSDQSGRDLIKRATESIHQDIYFAYDGNNIAQLSSEFNIDPDSIRKIIQHQASVMKAVNP